MAITRLPARTSTSRSKSPTCVRRPRKNLHTATSTDRADITTADVYDPALSWREDSLSLHPLDILGRIVAVENPTIPTADLRSTLGSTRAIDAIMRSSHRHIDVAR